MELSMRQARLSIATICVVPFLWAAEPAGAAAENPAPSTPSASSVFQSLSLLGYSAEALAIAGVSDDEVEQAKSFFAAQGEEFGLVRRLREALARSKNSGASEGSNATSLSETEIELKTRLSALRAAFLQVFTEPSRVLLLRWIGSEGYEVDSEYRVLEMEPAQWKQLEAAVGKQRASARTGEPLPANEQILIDHVRARAEVVSALAQLNNRAGAVRQSLRS